MKELEYPRFAVVGHPNKGKSTIVSALTSDKNILIGNKPGLTTSVRFFPLKKDNKILYEIIDTPGFQRPRKVLEWLESQPSTSTYKRRKIIDDFVTTYKDSDEFKDEVELLKVILDGAVIIYVVDASKPYSSEYETEMQILQWTGQPSMALLNFIGEFDYSEEWKSVLDYFFQMSRKINPMEMNFKLYLSIFESMAQLKEEWIEPIKDAIEVLEKDYNNSLDKTVEYIFDYLIEIKSSSYSEEVHTNIKFNIKDIYAKYNNVINNIEKNFQEKIEAIWDHNDLLKNIDNLDLSEDLITFNKSKVILGIRFKENNFLFKTFISKIPKAIKKLKYFKKYNIIYGPIENKDLSIFILFKALKYALLVVKYSHASRDKIIISRDEDINFMIKNNNINIDYLLKFLKKNNNQINSEFKKKLLKNIKDILISHLNN